MKLSTIEKLFPEEYAYIVNHAWDYVRTNSNVLVLLNSDMLSLVHLESIHNQLEADKAAAIKAEAERVKKEARGY
jgi:hypothetical protein